MPTNLGTLEYILKVNSEQAEKDLKDIEKLVKDQSGRIEKVFKKYGQTISDSGFESLKKKLASLKAQYEKLSLAGKGDTAVAKKKLSEIQQIETAVRVLNDAYKAQETALKAVETAAKKSAAEQKSAKESLDKQRGTAFVKDETEKIKAAEALDKQRSTAFVKRKKDEEAAVQSLAKQRSAAFVKEKVAAEKKIALDKKEALASREALDAQRSRALIQAENKRLRDKEIADKKKVTAATRSQLKLDKQLFAQQKLQAAVAATAAGSIGRLRAEYALMTLQLRNISKETPDATARIKQLSAAMAQHRQSISQLAPTEGLWGKLRRAILTYVAAYLSVQGAIASARAFFRQTRELDQLNFAMSTVIKSSTELAQTQEFLSETALAYGGDLLVLSERYIKFRAAAMQSNISAQETQKIYDSVSKAAGTLGLKTDELTGVYLALEQMISKGKVTTEELRRQLGERLPGAFGIMANALGVTIPQLDKMLKKGEVLSKDALPKFAVALEKAYGIESLKKIDNLAAAQGRLATNITGLIKGFEASDSFKNFFTSMAQFVGFLKENVGSVIRIFKAILSLTAGLATYKITMAAIIVLQKIRIRLGYEQIRGVIQLSVAQKGAAQTARAAAIATTAWGRAFNAFGGWIGIAITGVVALVSALALFRKTTKETVDAMEQLNKEQGQLVNTLNFAKAVLDNSGTSVDRYANALQEVNSIAIKYNQELLVQADNQEKVNESIARTIELVKEEYLEKRRVRLLDEADLAREEGVKEFREELFRITKEAGGTPAKALNSFLRFQEEVKAGSSKDELSQALFGKDFKHIPASLATILGGAIIEEKKYLIERKSIEDRYGLGKDKPILFDVDKLNREIEAAKDEFDKIAKIGKDKLAEPDLSLTFETEKAFLKSLLDEYAKFPEALEIIELRIADITKKAAKGVKTPAEIQSDELKAQITIVNELKKAYDDLTKIIGGGLAGKELEKIFGERVAGLGFEIDFELTDEKFAAWGERTIKAGNKLGKELGGGISKNVSKVLSDVLSKDSTDTFKKILSDFDRDLDEFKQKQKLKEDIITAGGDEELAIKIAFDEEAFTNSTDFIKNRILELVNETEQQSLFDGTYEGLVANIDKFSVEVQKRVEKLQKFLADKSSNMLLDALRFGLKNIPEGQDLEFDFSKVVTNFNSALDEIKKGVTSLEETNITEKLGFSEDDIERVKNLYINAANEIAKNSAEKLGKDFIKDSLPEQLANDFAHLKDASIQSLNAILLEINKMQAGFLKTGGIVDSLFGATKLDKETFQVELDLLLSSESEEAFQLNIQKVKDNIGDFDVSIPPEDIRLFKVFVDLAEQLGLSFKIAADEVERTKFENIARDAKKLQKEVEGLYDGIIDLSEALGSDLSDSAKESLDAIKLASVGIFGIIEGASKLATEEISNLEKASAILAIISAVIQIATAIVKVTKTLIDADRQSFIESEQAAIERLSIAYNNLERAKDKAYGTDYFKANAVLERNIEGQIAATQRLIALENEAKNPDDSKLKEYDAQVVELQNSLEDLKDSLINEILSDDVRSAADELGDSIVSAFERGESAAEAWGKTLKQIIFDAILESVKLDAIQEIIAPVIEYIQSRTKEWIGDQQSVDEIAENYDRQITAIFNRSDLNFAEKAREATRLNKERLDALAASKDIPDSQLLSDDQLAELQRLAEESERNAQPIFDFLEDFYKKIGLDADSAERGGIRGEIKGIQEDTARRLEGLLNSVREISVHNNGYLRRLADSNEMIQGSARQSLTHLSNIDGNTKGQLDLLTSLLVSSGTQGAKGLKVYVG